MSEELKEQLILLQQSFDNHLEECEHMKTLEHERWENFMKSQEENSRAIKDLSKSTEELSKSTADIIEAWDAVTGTAKVMVGLGKFVKWLSGFAFLGGLFTWCYDHL